MVLLFTANGGGGGSDDNDDDDDDDDDDDVFQDASSTPATEQDPEVLLVFTIYPRNRRTVF